MFILNSLLSVADLGGHSPAGIFLFQFHAVFGGKNGQNNRFAPPPLALEPPGKSWISHWFCYVFQYCFGQNISSRQIN